MIERIPVVAPKLEDWEIERNLYKEEYFHFKDRGNLFQYDKLVDKKTLEQWAQEREAKLKKLGKSVVQEERNADVEFERLKEKYILTPDDHSSNFKSVNRNLRLPLYLLVKRDSSQFWEFPETTRVAPETIRMVKNFCYYFFFFFLFF